MLETIGKDEVFTALNAEMFPVPPAAKPIDVVRVVQVYELAEPVKLTAVVALLLHTT